jgi:hypothetical protein
LIGVSTNGKMSLGGGAGGGVTEFAASSGIGMEAEGDAGNGSGKCVGAASACGMNHGVASGGANGLIETSGIGLGLAGGGSAAVPANSWGGSAGGAAVDSSAN